MDTTEIEKVIESLATKADGERTESADALRFSQAALNLANVLAVKNNLR